MKSIDQVDIRKAGIATGGSLLKASFAVACGKIVAVALGPGDFAVFGQYLLVITMLQGVACLGLANAHVVYFAKYAGGDAGNLNRHAAYSLALGGGVLVGIATVGVISFAPTFLQHIPLFPVWLRVLLFVYCALAPIVVAKGAELNAAGHLMSQQLLGMSLPLFQMLTLLLLICYSNITPAEAAAAYCAGFVVVGVPLAITKFNVRKSQPGSLGVAWQHYGSFVFAGLSVPLIASAGTITAFNVIKSHVLLQDAGVWFALWRLAEAYHGIITAIGATLFLPRLARAGPAITTVGCKLLLVMILLYTPWAIALLCWPAKTISLAFSQEFSTHLPSLLAQVLGDIFKLACSTCILMFISISRPRCIVAGEVMFAITFVSLLTFGIQGQGLARCLMLYAASYAVLATAMVVTLAFVLRGLRN